MSGVSHMSDSDGSWWKRGGEVKAKRTPSFARVLQSSSFWEGDARRWVACVGRGGKLWAASSSSSVIQPRSLRGQPYRASSAQVSWRQKKEVLLKFALARLPGGVITRKVRLGRYLTSILGKLFAYLRYLN